MGSRRASRNSHEWWDATEREQTLRQSGSANERGSFPVSLLAFATKITCGIVFELATHALPNLHTFPPCWPSMGRWELEKAKFSKSLGTLLTRQIRQPTKQNTRHHSRHNLPTALRARQLLEKTSAGVERFRDVFRTDVCPTDTSGTPQKRRSKRRMAKTAGAERQEVLRSNCASPSIAVQ